MSQTGIGIAFTPTRNQTSTVIRFTQTKNILPLQPTCCNKHFLYDNHQLQYDIYEPVLLQYTSDSKFYTPKNKGEYVLLLITTYSLLRFDIKLG